jgi:hypothetical protein
MVLRYVVPCYFVAKYLSFGEMCYVRCYCTTKKGEAGPFETSVPIYLSILLHITVSSSLRKRWFQVIFKDTLSSAKLFMVSGMEDRQCTANLNGMLRQ